MPVPNYAENSASDSCRLEELDKSNVHLGLEAVVRCVAASKR